MFLGRRIGYVASVCNIMDVVCDQRRLRNSFGVFDRLLTVGFANIGLHLIGSLISSIKFPTDDCLVEEDVEFRMWFGSFLLVTDRLQTKAT